MPGFNPNLGKNVVQSLKENKTLKNALDAMKNTPIPVAVRTVDTGIGMKLPYIESSTVGEVAGKFSKASTAAKDDAYQLAKGSGGVKGTGDDSTYRHLKDYESNTYFTRSVEYNAGKEGTGFTYKVYQRGDIDWNMVRTKGAKKGTWINKCRSRFQVRSSSYP